MLGRELTDDETVDHINRNTLDNDWRNLQVVTRSDHGRLTRARANGEHASGDDEATERKGDLPSCVPERSVT